MFCGTIELTTHEWFLLPRRMAMATMIDGESYVGRVLIRPLSQSGDLRLYLWPLRCLKSQRGGPTFGIEVKGEEILRFDAHGPRGHWHKGGYDKLRAGAGGEGRRSPLPRHRPRIAGGLTCPPPPVRQSRLGASCARRAARVGPA